MGVVIAVADWLVPVAVALIALVGVLGSPIVTAVVQRRVQAENRRDHASVKKLAEQVHDRLTALNTALLQLDRRVETHSGDLSREIDRVEQLVVDHVTAQLDRQTMTQAEILEAIDSAISAISERKPS